MMLHAEWSLISSWYEKSKRWDLSSPVANKGAKKDSKHCKLTALCSRESEYVVEIAFPVDKLCSASLNARMNKYIIAEPM